jgi:hypothetical protein
MTTPANHKQTIWRKIGRIIQPNGQLDWMISHAMVPVADWQYDDIYRIYFSGRDDKNRSLIGYAEIDLNDPFTVKRFSEKPVLGLGALGCFDDNGVTPSWLINVKGKKYLYYIGWNQGSTVRMHLVAGLAMSDDGGESFERVLRVPILDRTNDEPYTLNTGPCVMIEADLWRMWYVSGVEWVHRDLPRYNIKYAESRDGLHWKRPGTCIDFASRHETSLARPCVIKEEGLYKMWFSYKGENYRIGYAESDDGLLWRRLDQEAGIDVSSSGWDSEMIEYTYVFTHKNAKYMLYNGNGYGYDGIGLAIAEQ